MPYLRPSASSASCTAVSIAYDMSVRRAPGRIAAMPANMALRVAADRSRSACPTVPTATVTAESPCQPSRIAPQSIEIRSPSASTCRPAGMPCTTCSLTDAQIVAGKPW